MNYILPQELRNALLVYMEQRECVKDADLGYPQPNDEMRLAALLRDLTPVREVDTGAGIRACFNAPNGGPIS